MIQYKSFTLQEILKDHTLSSLLESLKPSLPASTKLRINLTTRFVYQLEDKIPTKALSVMESTLASTVRSEV